jgi:CRP-like cAMP-binding protein
MLVYLFDRLTLFDDLDSRQSALLRPLFRPFHEPAGTVIFEQGNLAEYLYIVVEGEVNIRYKPDDGPPLTVARVRPQGIVGWSAAIGSPAYTSSAICSQDCQLLGVRGYDLRRLCEQHPETGRVLLERLAALIAVRLHKTNHHVFALLQQGLRLGVDSSITT